MLKLASTEQAKLYMDEARKWVESTDGLWEGFAAISAIAEYNANETGFTLYESRVTCPKCEAMKKQIDFLKSQVKSNAE